MKSSDSISTVVLTSDADDHQPVEAPNETPVEAPDQALRTQFRRQRILTGALVVVALFAPAMLVLCGDGVRFQQFPDGTYSDGTVKQLVDFYNSVTGSAGSLVSKPMEIFLAMLTSTAFLCFATESTLAQGQTGYQQYRPVVAVTGITYLFSNGLNALNVQVVPGELKLQVGEKDLDVGSIQDDQPLYANGSLLTPWERAYLENAANNSVLNTILRSKLAPFTHVTSECNGAGYEAIEYPIVAVPTVAFGFPSHSWQQSVLSRALKPIQTLKIPLSIRNASELPPVSALPSPSNVTENLVRVGLNVLNGLGVGSAISTPFAASTPSTFMNASHGAWIAALNQIANVSMSDASVEYSRFELAEHVAFEAATLEFAVARRQFDKYGSEQPKIDGYNWIRVDDYCNRDGCLIPPVVVGRYGVSTTIQPRVQVTSICVLDDGVTEDETAALPPCKRSSTTSMRVASIGMRIEGDDWDLKPETDGTTMMQLTNLRTVYSITVARLSWAIEDLAAAFSADCVATSADKCDGVRTETSPIVTESEYLLVGKSKLPIEKLNTYTSSGSLKWIYLVSGADGMGEQRYDVLTARHFANVTARGLSLRTIPSPKCNTYADDYIRSVEKNHLYMESSVQPGYTAAFYYLFQNAVVVGRKGNAGADAPQFFANIQIMDARASVPMANVVISLLGCALVLGISIGIAIHVGSSEQEIQKRASAAVVTAAMMNTTKYPPSLVEMVLEQDAASRDSETQDKRVRYSLQDLRVESATITHHAETHCTFHVGSSSLDKA